MSKIMNKKLLRNLPKVDELLNNKTIKRLCDTYSRKFLVDIIRETLDSLRKDIVSDKDCLLAEDCILVENIVNKIEAKVLSIYSYKLKRVINATGVVIHTNLGRSCLPYSIREHFSDIATCYSTLEFDINNGKRGSRYSHVEDLLCRITGSEAAMVVNNNAAAVMLTLSTMCKDTEVIVSRGQLVEIGGSFRIPEVMKQSGAKLVEVGATNKTHLKDYEGAITEETSALLKVHTSNYRILGFAEEVEAKELVPLANQYNIPVIEDIGSGSLIDLSKYGLMKEPTVREAIESGVDVVTFSGDKMLGGPQAGIIVGKKKYIDAMKKNQLTRALRVDKMTLSALEGTLKCYLDETTVIDEIPTLKMLTMSYEETVKRAVKLKDMIDKSVIKGVKVTLCKDYSEVGGGSLPLEKLPSEVLKITVDGYTPNKLIDSFRELTIPIIARILDDTVVIDTRTLFDGEFKCIVDLLAELVYGEYIPEMD